MTRHVTFNLYNILGQKVRTLVDDVQQPGLHRLSINADGLASGIYVLKLRASSKRNIKKALLLK